MDFVTRISNEMPARFHRLQPARAARPGDCPPASVTRLERLDVAREHWVDPFRMRRPAERPTTRCRYANHIPKAALWTGPSVPLNSPNCAAGVADFAGLERRTQVGRLLMLRRVGAGFVAIDVALPECRI